jgi:hypothetical protein
MSRQLQSRADDLAECLLVAELEMRRSWNLEKRLEAFRDFGRIVDRIDGLRRDAEEVHATEELAHFISSVFACRDAIDAVRQQVCGLL